MYGYYVDGQTETWYIEIGGSTKGTPPFCFITLSPEATRAK